MTFIDLNRLAKSGDICQRQWPANFRHSFFYFIPEKNHNHNNWPAKCIYWLLQRLFYSVENTESIDENAKKFTSEICVSYNTTCEYKSELSKIDAKNHASLKVLQQLCEVENQLVQQIWNEKFPNDFAHEVQR